MNESEALEFLKNNQPMPSDTQVSQRDCDDYLFCLKLFSSRINDKCIPLFINSVSQNTGLGMYEAIEEVLAFQNRGQVEISIICALKNGSNAVKYRCCWWAASLKFWKLEEFVWPLINTADTDLKEAARCYLELNNSVS